MNIGTLNKTLSLAARLLDPVRPTKPCISQKPQKPSLPIPPIQMAFPRVTPEQVGIPSENVKQFLQALTDDETLNMHNVMLLRNGKVFCEVSFGAQRMELPKMTFSACKSVTSLAIGMLMDDGMLHEDDRLIDLFADEMSKIQKLRLKNVTIKELLTMTTDVSFNEAGTMTEENWKPAYFSSLGGREVHPKFRYNSLNSYILSAIVCRKTGKTLSAFLNERLFEPLGIDSFFWETSPEKIEKGGWGLYLQPESMAKLGQLVMQNGSWDGKQLVSESYISKATTPQVRTPVSTGAGFSYGYQFWCKRNGHRFLFNGMLGQNVQGIRDNGILVVTNAGNDESFQQSTYYDYVDKYLSDEFGDTLKPDEASYEELQRFISAQSAFFPEKPPVLRKWWQFFKKPEPQPGLPDACALLDGVSFAPQKPAPFGLLPVFLQAVQNNYSTGLREIAFRTDGDRFLMEYRENDLTNVLELHFDNAVSDETAVFHGEPYRTVAHASFGKNEDGWDVLKIRVDFLETPDSRVIKLYFKPDRNDADLYLCEFPGKKVVLETIDETIKGLPQAGRKLLDTAIGKIDPDFVEYKIERLLEPRILMKKT